MIEFRYGGMPPFARKNLSPFVLSFTYVPALTGSHSSDESAFEAWLCCTFFPVAPSRNAKSDAERNRSYTLFSLMVFFSGTRSTRQMTP